MGIRADSFSLPYLLRMGEGSVKGKGCAGSRQQELAELCESQPGSELEFRG